MAARLAALPGTRRLRRRRGCSARSARRRRGEERRRGVLRDRLRFRPSECPASLPVSSRPPSARQRQRHLRRRLDLRHRRDDLGLGLLRRHRRRLRFEHVRPGARSSGDAGATGNGASSMITAAKTPRPPAAPQASADIPPSTEMRRADDRGGQAPAPEFLPRGRVRQMSNPRVHFASRSSNPTSATLRKPAERSAFMTSMTSPYVTARDRRGEKCAHRGCLWPPSRASRPAFRAAPDRRRSPASGRP